MPSPSAVLVDMDGLLVDSEPLWRRVEIEVFARYGVTLDEELCRTTKGMFVHDVARHWYRGDDPEKVANEIVDEMEQVLRAGVALMPGALAALEFFERKQLPMALASSSPMRLITAVVDRWSLRRWFSSLHSAEDEPAGKPDPAIFLSAARALSVAPECCVVLEDSLTGVEAALNAGMGCIWVPENAEQPHPNSRVLMIESLDQVGDGLWKRVSALLDACESRRGTRGNSD